MSGTSMPRAAMSVATSTRALPRRNMSSAFWRAFCDLLPWMASAHDAGLQIASATRLAPCLVRVKTMTRSANCVGEQLLEQGALLRRVHEVHALRRCGRRSPPAASPRRARGRAGFRGPAWRCRSAWWPRTAATAASSAASPGCAHVTDEAHVEHAVGFVEHEGSRPVRASRCRCCTRSSRRPGVAIRMSTPRQGSRSDGLAHAADTVQRSAVQVRP
jgi:hypothetical protein